MTRTRLAASLGLVLGTALATPALAAAPFSMAPAAPVAAPAPGAAVAAILDPTLRRLPASPAALEFTGENPHADFPLFVTAAETATTATLVLAYRSAVSIAPESSLLRVLVNDTVVSESRLGIGDARTLSAELPTGLLQPGFNAVRVEVRQRHRVDCSVEGTYELWTRLDPAASGLRFSGSVPIVGSLDDLPALQPDAQGRTRIHAQVAPGASAEDLQRTMRAVQAASLIGRFQAPLVDIGASADDGVGLDLLVGTDGALAGAASGLGNTDIPNVSFVPSTATTRARLVVSGASAAELDAALAALAVRAQTGRPLGSEPGLAVAAREEGLRIQGGETVSLGDLGLSGESFTGRFLRDEAAISLPADFYAADYGYASVVLDAAYAGGLSKDAQLIVRANGAIVSTLSLASSRSGRIERQHLRLPLSALKPGLNTIGFEARTPAPSDAACEPMAQIDPPVRFTLSGTSSLVMPRLARVGHYPDISAMASGVAQLSSDRRDLALFVPGLEPASLDAAGTLVARMAIASGQVRGTRIFAAMPHEETGDLLAVGPFRAMPDALLRAVSVSAGDAGSSLADGRPAGWTSIEAQASEGPEAPPAIAGTAGDDVWPPVRFPNVMDRASEIVQPILAPIMSAVGRAKASEADRPVAGDGLVVAQAGAPFARASAWTLVSAPTSAMLEKGVGRVTEGRNWASLGGSMTQIADADGAVEVTAARGEALFETQPRSLGNERLIIAGWFSRHLQEYVAMLIGISALLGLTTFLFLRHVGVRAK